MRRQRRPGRIVAGDGMMRTVEEDGQSVDALGAGAWDVDGSSRKKGTHERTPVVQYSFRQTQSASQTISLVRRRSLLRLFMVVAR